MLHPLLAAAGLFAAAGPTVFEPRGQTPYLSPEESLKTIEIQDGYRLELVLAEPVIRDPVSIAFDGNGRMYVAEMRTYMQDIDGKDELTPRSRVSRHESSRRDGRFDKHTVYRNDLLLPRQLLPLDDRVIIGETNTDDLFIYRDTNGDGIADQKQDFYRAGPRGGNLEHQPQGLLWSLDNWLYSTYNAYRLRWTPKGALKEPTASNGGQWGVAHDDDGTIWWSNAGGERGILNFQTHVAYAAFDLPEQQPPGFREVFPLVGIPDVQGGKIRFRPTDNTLNHTTGTCGQTIYRDVRLPGMQGDVILPEPVGRLIRRIKVEKRDGITYVRNAYDNDKSEFIRSRDPNFRPIYSTTGPDGAIYIVDMYRGIIQEGNWVRPDSYLRPVVQAHGLEKNFGRGRIWRLTHPSFKPGPQPRMLDEKPAAWVRHLAHPNGWWRDTAQKLLVVRGDRSVLPALTKMARSDGNELARMHALWTIEGLEAVDPPLLTAAFADKSPRVRATAVRVAESYLKDKGEHPLRQQVIALSGDPDARVVIQVLGTARRLRWQWHEILIRETATASESHGVKMIAPRLLETPDPVAWKTLKPAEVKVLQRGRAIYDELCFACHGPDGTGSPLQGAPERTIAPPLKGSKIVVGPVDLPVGVLLHGLTGPVDGKAYDALMVPMRDNDDAWIAGVLSYVRNAFGNKAPLVAPEEVARLRARTAARTQPWTTDELPKILSTP